MAELETPFEFEIVTQPEAIEQTINLTDMGVIEPVEDEVSRDQAIPKYLKKAVWTKDLDPNNTVLIDVGCKGLKILPMSNNVIEKLLALDKFQSDNMNWIGQSFSFVNIANTGWLTKNNPIIMKMNDVGIRVALTPNAWGRLDSYRKDLKRFFTPYTFQVPDEFKDIDNKNDIDITGPFVEEVYKEEIKNNLRKLSKLGLRDKTSDFYLKDFQAEDVAKIAIKRFGYIGHEQGLGKTTMAVSTALLLGYDRVLVICPATAIGTFSSGWRHEIKRCGVPEENIHILEHPEDIPGHKGNVSSYAKNGKPHFFLVDYNTLAKEKVEYSQFNCPKCHKVVTPDMKGVCNNPVHKTKKINTGRVDWRGRPITQDNPNFIEGMRKLSYCPVCYDKEYHRNKKQELSSKELDLLKDMWTGNYCDPKRQGCGFRARFRVNTEGRKKKNLREVKPIWKCMKRGLFGAIFIDESHMIKNITSKRSLAVQMLRGAKRVYIMTGTMMTNYVEDTFWQLQRLCQAGLFPINGELKDYFAYQVGTGRGWQKSKTGYNEFVDRFQGQHLESGSAGKITTINDPKTFWQMLSCFMVRRRSNDDVVERDILIPPADFHTELIEMDPVHSLIYRSKTGEFQKDMIAKIKASHGGIIPQDITLEKLSPVNEAEVQAKLSILRQIAVCPDQEVIYNKEMTTKDIRMLEIVEEKMKDGRKTVIFCSFTDHVRRLEDIFKRKNIPAMVIDSRVSKAKKWTLIDQWRSQDTEWVLITTLNILGQAVNLTPLVPDFKTDTIIFGSPDWVPATMYQAWRRLARLGQTERTQVYQLWHKDTIEQDIDELLEAKKKVIALAIDRVDIERQDTVTQLSAHDIAHRIMMRAKAQEND